MRDRALRSVSILQFTFRWLLRMPKRGDKSPGRLTISASVVFMQDWSQLPTSIFFRNGQDFAMKARALLRKRILRGVTRVLRGRNWRWHHNQLRRSESSAMLMTEKSNRRDPWCFLRGAKVLASEWIRGSLSLQPRSAVRYFGCGWKTWLRSR